MFCFSQVCEASFHIPLREPLWRRLRLVCTDSQSAKIPLVGFYISNSQVILFNMIKVPLLPTILLIQFVFFFRRISKHYASRWLTRLLAPPWNQKRTDSRQLHWRQQVTSTHSSKISSTIHRPTKPSWPFPARSLRSLQSHRKSSLRRSVRSRW